VQPQEQQQVRAGVADSQVEKRISPLRDGR
jgi:hypothetical protein